MNVKEGRKEGRQEVVMAYSKYYPGMSGGLRNTMKNPQSR
jgi:hypothetical protein